MKNIFDVVIIDITGKINLTPYLSLSDIIIVFFLKKIFISLKDSRKIESIYQWIK